jgi:hypothetical protein
MQSIIANVSGGGVGGAILMAIVGIIKDQMAKKLRDGIAADRIEILANLA